MLIFLKLGGSLITDKDKPYTARRTVIARIADEILTARREQSDLQILMGHGSGSFGHFAAKDYGTRYRVTNSMEWQGFQKVWNAARTLNQIIVEEFVQAGLPVISLPASASVFTENRNIVEWNTKPIQSALENGLMPIIFGDVIFDRRLGGIIFSTEDLFTRLLPSIQPNKILLAGKEAGVWRNYPNDSKIIPAIDAAGFHSGRAGVGASASVDVTGGMAAKVQLMLEVVTAYPQIQAYIFSGDETGNIYKMLTGASMGTRIQS